MQLLLVSKAPCPLKSQSSLSRCHSISPETPRAIDSVAAKAVLTAPLL